MNSTQPSRVRLLLIATALVAVGSFWSFRQMHFACTELNEALDSLGSCRELHDDILSLRAERAEVNWFARSDYRPGQSIDQALKAAGIEAPSLTVTATAGQSGGESQFVEVPIGLPTLENVSFEQAIKFLTALENGPTRHQVGELEFTANKSVPPTPLEQPRWNLDCQISYLARTNETQPDAER